MCQPRHNIMYLKTHKCASSTLQNIFFRYAMTHSRTSSQPKARAQAALHPGINLYQYSSKNKEQYDLHKGIVHEGGSERVNTTWQESEGSSDGGTIQGDPIFVAVPATGTYIGNPKTFTANMMKNPAWLLPPDSRVNMFAVHSRLAAREVREVVEPGALWVTAVRHPVPLYISLYHYFKVWEAVGEGLRTYLARPLHHLSFSRRINGRIGINQMTFDLGYGQDTFYNEDKIHLMIKEVEKNFDLVLVTERMDESLVLLGHALCWTIHDILALRKNVRIAGTGEGADTEKEAETEVGAEAGERVEAAAVGGGGKEKGPLLLTEEEKTKIAQLNYADLRLYQHFTAKFDLLVEEYGREKLKAEVDHLRWERKKLEEFCVKETVSGHDPRASVKEYSEGVLGFSLTRPHHPTCRALAWNAKQFVEYFRRQQKRLFFGPPRQAGREEAHTREDAGRDKAQ